MAGKSVNVVVTDLNMPVMDGMTLIRELRAKPDFKFTPILMLTTESQDTKKAEGARGGGDRLDRQAVQPPATDPGHQQSRALGRSEKDTSDEHRHGPVPGVLPLKRLRSTLRAWRRAYSNSKALPMTASCSTRSFARLTRSRVQAPPSAFMRSVSLRTSWKSLLDRMRDGELQPTAESTELLLRSVDVLAGLLSAARDGTPEPEDVEEVATQLQKT